MRAASASVRPPAHVPLVGVKTQLSWGSAFSVLSRASWGSAFGILSCASFRRRHPRSGRSTHHARLRLLTLRAR
jgi:hypothetical protein